MKRILSVILCVLLIASLAVSVFAATAVPEPVMKATESVVRVLSEYAEGYATGSGFVIKSDKDETLITTNYHVVEGKPYSISIWLSEDETVSATILAYIDQKDLCILKLAYPITIPALTFAENGAQQGDAVFAVGFPGAADYLSDKAAHTSADATITDGIVSAAREATVSNYGTPTKILQINAAINSGNSGGPLFNENGEVVGINTYGINNAQGIFGAIDVSELKDFMADNNIPIPMLAAKAEFPWLLILAVLGVIICIIVLVIVVKAKKKKSAKMQTAVNAIPLWEYMANYPDGLGTNEAVAMLLPVALCLRDLHNDGKTHLQISPNSISVGTNGAVLANATSAESDRYASGYAAPEIYKGLSAGNLSDVYSFCAVLSYVASGKQPINSLSRTENENEEAELMQADEGFVDVIKTGMAIASENRLASMQDVIIKLSPYNIQSFSSTPAEPAAAIVPPEKRSKRFVAFAAIFAVVAVVGSLCITYFVSYDKAKFFAGNGDFTAAEDTLLVPQITKLHDSQLISYLEAGRMLTARQYEKAKEQFSELSGYLNADEMVLEADYRHAAQYADANNFENAILVMETLKKVGYKDSANKILEFQYRKGIYLLQEEGDYRVASIIFDSLRKVDYDGAEEMYKEARYQWAFALIDEEKYVDAYIFFKAIKDYSNVDEVMDSLTELMYLEGQDLYSNKKYTDAKKIFDCISDYSNSQKYLTLIKARSEGKNSPKYTVQELIKIFYFEDASELLMYNHQIAKEFLKGVWKSNNGYYKLEWDTDGTWLYCNLPYNYSEEYYYISQGEFRSYTTSQTNYITNFTVELLTPDSMKVYCHKDKSTHILYRE